MQTTGLLLIDIQNDYFPDGKMELVGSDQAGQIAGQLLATFRQNNLPIIHIQHISLGERATFFLPNTTGVAIHATVQPTNNEIVIQKRFPNSFRETDLLAQLQQMGIQQLVIAGMMTHMCVDATTRAATDHGYECMIAADGCATRNLTFAQREVAAADVHTAFLAALHGAYGKVTKAEDIISKLQPEEYE